MISGSKDINKACRWDDFTNSTPVLDVQNTKTNDNNFSILCLTQESIDVLPHHPAILYYRGKALEAILEVDVIVKYHKDCLWEFEPAFRYIHTGTRRWLSDD